MENRLARKMDDGLQRLHVQQQESSNNRPAVTDYNVRQKERDQSLQCSASTRSRGPVASAADGEARARLEDRVRQLEKTILCNPVRERC